MTKTIEKIIKRNGESVNFDKKRIFSAIQKAFYTQDITDLVLALTDEVVNNITANSHSSQIKAESVQDSVEEALMKMAIIKLQKNTLFTEKHQKPDKKNH